MKSMHVHIRPYRPSTNSRVDVYIAAGRDPSTFGVADLNWNAAFSRQPEKTMELFDLTLSGKFQVPQLRFEIMVDQLVHVADAAELHWKGSPVFFYSVDDLNWSTRTIEFAGRISSAPYSNDRRKIGIEAQGSLDRVTKPLLTASFDGSGGLGGEPEKRDLLKPAGWGEVENLSPVFFDETRNMAMLDGYGNLQQIHAVFEGLNPFTSFAGDYANIAALTAAYDAGAILEGQWASSIADGIIVFGAPPVGEITCHARFGLNRPGAIMKSWLLDRADLDPLVVAESDFDDLDAAMPYDVRFWTDQQQDIKTLMEQMCATVLATPIIRPDNQIGITSIIGGAPAAVLDKSGAQLPRVIASRQAEQFTPTYKTAARAARPAVVLRRDQVNFADNFVPMGVFKLTAEYRLGNTVFGPDKAEWLYINETPALGASAPLPVWPVESNAYWQNLQPPVQLEFVVGNLDDIPDGTARAAVPPTERDKLFTVENYATRGAPVGSLIAGTPAEAIVADVANNKGAVAGLQEDAAELFATTTNIASDVAEAQADITDLFTVYGDTVSAAMSAAEAANSAFMAAADAASSQAARLASEGARDASQQAKDLAQTAAANSASAQTAAETARNQAQAAQTAANASQVSAAQQAANALAQAQAAAGSAGTAAGHATTAATKADEAAGSASVSAAQALIATSKAGEAAGSATASATSATNAQTSATAAGNSAAASQTSRLASEAARDTAAGFAAAASVSRDEAVGASSTAAGHASTAATQASLATSARDTAAGHASAANTSRNEAASFAGQAGASAVAASTSVLSAQIAATTLAPSTFADGGTYFAGLYGDEQTSARPEAYYGSYYYPVTADYGRVLRIPNFTGYAHVTIRRRIRRSEHARRFRLVVQARQVINPAQGNAILVAAIYGLGGNWGTLSYGGFFDSWDDTGSVTQLNVAAGLVSATFEFSLAQNPVPDGLGNTATDGVTAGCYVVNQGNPGGWDSGVCDIVSMQLSDITEQHNAGQSAAASASSAASAAVSETNAGQQANSAQQSANLASTRAGEASTSASQAASSASGAAGSASTASTQAALSAVARASAQAASQASIPDNFIDANNWSNYGSWGGSILIEGGLLKTFNGGSCVGNFSLPLAAGQRYRITARHRVVNQGGGEFYMGFAAVPNSGAVYWATSGFSSAVGVWRTDSVECSGDDLLVAFPGQNAIRPLILLGYNGVSDGECSMLRIENITAAHQSAQSAAASLTHSQNAAAQSTAAGASASAAQASRLAAEAANGLAQTAATNAANSSSIADGHRAAAASSASLSAAFSNTRGITPNGNFGAGTQEWLDPSNNIEAIASFDGRSGLLRNKAGGAVNGMYGRLVNVDTSRKYRVRARLRVATGGNAPVIFYVGFGGFDASQGYLTHHDGTYNYPAAAGQPVTQNEGWREFISPVFTGEGMGSLLFPVGTRFVTPVFFGDYLSSGNIFYLDELYIEDVTESTDAQASATVASSSAATAGAHASTAQTNANLSATYRDQASASATSAQQNAGVASSQRAIAESAAAAASGSAATADGHRASAASSASLAAGHASTAQSQANAASASATAADSSRAQAASSAALSATYRDQSNAAFQNSLILDGNLNFQQGLSGWTSASAGIVADDVTPPGYVGAAWGTGRNYWIVSHVQAEIFSRKSFEVDTSRRYELKGEFGAWAPNAAQSQIYLGFVGLDSSGAVLNHGAYGTFRYALATGEIVQAGNLVQNRRVIVTGEGNDSWTKFPTGTKRIRLYALVNYAVGVNTLGNPAAYIGPFEINDVTDREAAASSASAASASAATADGHRASAASSASLAASYRDQAAGSASGAAGSASAASSSAGASSASAATAAAHASTAQTQANLAASFKSGAAVAASETFPSTFDNDGEYFSFLYGSETTAARVQDAYGAVITYPVRGDFGKVLRINYSGGYTHITARKRIPRASTRRYRITARCQVLVNSALGFNYCVATCYGLTADYSTLTYDGVSYAASPGVSQALMANTASGVFEIGIDFWSGPTSAGTVWMVPGIYVIGHDGPSTVGPTGVVDIISVKIEDVTDSIRSTTQADIATAQAASANSQRALAETAANLSASYRDQAQGHANTAASQASAASSQAAIATAAAASAVATSNLVARINTGTINPNPGMIEWNPSVRAWPEHWAEWTGGSPTRVTNTVGDAAARFTCAQGQEQGMAQYEVGDLGTLTPGKYVLEATVSMVSGPNNGSGILVYWFNAAQQVIGQSTIAFHSDPDITGTSPGAGWVPNQVRRFSKTITAPANTAKGRIYAMSNWGGFGAPELAAKTIDFHYVGLKPAGIADAGFGQIQASVTTLQGAVATLEGATAFLEQIVAASGGDPAVFRMLAGKNGSAISLAANRLVLQNYVNGDMVDVARFQNGQAQFNDAMIRRLQVLARSNASIYLPVMLRPIIRLGSDGQVIQYQNGNTFGALPEKITPDLNGLPALAAGESYDIRAINVTPTQFQVYAKKLVAAEPVGQNTGAGANIGGVPQWRADKPTALDAYNGNYQYTFQVIGQLVDSEPAPGGGGYYFYQAAGNLYATDAGGNWQVIGSYNEFWGGFNASGTRWHTQSASSTMAIGQNGGYEFGVHPTQGAVSAFDGVIYATQVQSSINPVSGAISWTITPPAPD